MVILEEYSEDQEAERRFEQNAIDDDDDDWFEEDDWDFELEEDEDDLI